MDSTLFAMGARGVQCDTPTSSGIIYKTPKFGSVSQILPGKVKAASVQELKLRQQLSTTLAEHSQKSRQSKISRATP